MPMKLSGHVQINLKETSVVSIHGIINSKAICVITKRSKMSIFFLKFFELLLLYGGNVVPSSIRVGGMSWWCVWKNIMTP